MDNGLINNDLIEINPPMEDLTPSTPICECKKCEVEREIDVLLGQPCECTYKDVEKTDIWVDEDGVEQSHTYIVTEVDVKCARCTGIELLKDKLDKYNTLEQANINETNWDECDIVDGVISFPTDGKFPLNYVEKFKEVDSGIMMSTLDLDFRLMELEFMISGNKR